MWQEKGAEMKDVDTHGYVLELVKPIHMAKMMNDNGDVSPLCAKKPRKINLKKETWTIRAEAVTCSKCRKKLGLPESSDIVVQETKISQLPNDWRGRLLQ
jgi:hypothetical protein